MKRWFGILSFSLGLLWVGFCEVNNRVTINAATSVELSRRLTKDQFSRDEMFDAIVGTGRGISARRTSSLPGVAAIVAGLILMGHPGTPPRSDG